MSKDNNNESNSTDENQEVIPETESSEKGTKDQEPKEDKKPDKKEKPKKPKTSPSKMSFKHMSLQLVRGHDANGNQKFTFEVFAPLSYRTDIEDPHQLVSSAEVFLSDEDIASYSIKQAVGESASGRGVIEECLFHVWESFRSSLLLKGYSSPALEWYANQSTGNVASAAMKDAHDKAKQAMFVEASQVFNMIWRKFYLEQITCIDIRIKQLVQSDTVLRTGFNDTLVSGGCEADGRDARKSLQALIGYLRCYREEKALAYNAVPATKDEKILDWVQYLPRMLV